jgi:catechol 2,3-dioxygenase-like lactoylglutathione lyase family enzyme
VTTVPDAVASPQAGGFTIETPLFHTGHVVRDMFEAADRYISLFDRAVLYTGHSAPARRRAGFVLVAEVWIEIVGPDPGSATGRFIERFGEHLQGLAFKVRGIDALAESLAGHGVRFADETGRPAGSPVPRHGPIVHPRFGPTTPLAGGVECEDDWWSAVIYTHMGDAHGWYEFCQPKLHHNRIDPRQAPGWQPGPRAGDPLGITGGSHCTVVVADLDATVRLWRDALHAQVLREATSAALGTRSCFVRVGEGAGSVIEFAQPDGDGPAARDRAAAGRDIQHSVTFRVASLDQIRKHLDAIGCPVETDTGTLVVTDPSWCLGARYGFTASPVDLV